MGGKEETGSTPGKACAFCGFLVRTAWGRQSIKGLDDTDKYKHLLNLETAMREGMQVS